jgi:hypothetical protein
MNSIALSGNFLIDSKMIYKPGYPSSTSILISSFLVTKHHIISLGQDFVSSIRVLKIITKEEEYKGKVGRKVGREREAEKVDLCNLRHGVQISPLSNISYFATQRTTLKLN